MIKHAIAKIPLELFPSLLCMTQHHAVSYFVTNCSFSFKVLGLTVHIIVVSNLYGYKYSVLSNMAESKIISLPARSDNCTIIAP